VNSVKTIFAKYPGVYTANFSVRDKKEKINLDFFSKEYKVDLSSEMTDELSLVPGLNFRLV